MKISTWLKLSGLLLGLLLAGPGWAQRSAAGNFFTLSIHPDGTLWAWGANDLGQLGIGPASATSQLLPTQVGTAANWQSVAAGYGHSLALRTDGTLWAWGGNNAGQLGTGTTTDQAVPAQVGTGTAWQRLAAGAVHSLAIRQDGTLWAWGDNRLGQLGLGSRGATSVPVQVGTGTSWRSVAAQSANSAAIRGDNTLWTWGDNSTNQVGTGTTAPQATPVQIGQGAAWQAVAVGGDHSLALRTDGSLWAWGYNYNGQLGIDPANPTPAYVPGGAALPVLAPGPPSACTLAPNPAHEQAVRVLGLPAGPVQVRVHDAQGWLVREAAAATVPVQGLAPGLYLLRIATAGRLRTLRLVVE